MSALLEAALALARARYYVLPLEPNGKAPLGRLVPHGKDNATVDEATIRSWWTTQPDANIGIAAQPTRLAVLDVDVKNEKRGRESHATIAAQLPETLTAITASNGWHNYYSLPEGIEPPQRIGFMAGVDLIAKGYVVAPPSVIDGVPYRWQDPSVPIAPLPQLLLDLAAKPAPSSTASTDGGAIPEGQRNATLFKRGCAMRRVGFDESAIAAALLVDNQQRCKPPLPEVEVRQIARQAAGYSPSADPLGGLILHDALRERMGGKPWITGDQVPALIDRFKDEPWVELCLSGRKLTELRPGNIATVVGGTAAGKTSLAICMIVEHLRVGPVVVCSLELPADEFGARQIGIERNASWADVLRGRVPNMSLPRKLMIIPRECASLETYEAAIREAQASYPGELVMGAVDYVQLVKSAEREIRARRGDAMERIDGVTRRTRSISVVLSQTSNANQAALRKGEKVGADAVDTAADAAEIARWSNKLITIGETTAEHDDGSKSVNVSIGKERMAQGDVVVPMRYHGLSGRWEIVGERVAASKVREAKKGAEKAKTVTTDDQLVIAVICKAESLGVYHTQNQWVKDGGIELPEVRIKRAIRRLVDSGRAYETTTHPTKPHKRDTNPKSNGWIVPGRAPAPVDLDLSKYGVKP